jgi:CubicO group peptidase (beta-lactamase class C family)
MSNANFSKRVNMKKRSIQVLVFFVIGVLIFACNSQSSKMNFPGMEWQKATPESQGVDGTIMLEALNYLKSKSFEEGIEEVMIIRNGRLIYEGDSTYKNHNIWSCTKSFTSTVLGLMVHEGICALDDQVYQYEPVLEAQYKDVTFRHFATMTSGYNAVGGSRWNEESEDWSLTPYDPATPLFTPGTHYAYWDEAMMMNGRVLTRIVQQTMKSYLDEKVMSKIGFGPWEWHTEGEVDGVPINNGCTNVSINARQLARFGHLYLNRGNWNGEQIIPESWVEMATSVQVPESIPVADTDRKSAMGSGSYGFNWWVNGGLSAMPDAPRNLYYASGLNHNVCFVIPEWDMVIVRMGVDGNPPEGKHVVWNEFLRRLTDAVR